MHAYGLCRACHDREWRKSQGPGSNYRIRASISSKKRGAAYRDEMNLSRGSNNSEGRDDPGGEVGAARPSDAPSDLQEAVA